MVLHRELSDAAKLAVFMLLQDTRITD